MGKNTRPDGADDLVISMVKQAITDAKKGNGHSQSAKEFLADDTWAKMLGVSEDTKKRIRAIIGT